MKTETAHISRFGSMGFRYALDCIDSEGYATYHDSVRYHTAGDDQLDDWAVRGRTVAVRNAARIEQADRMRTA